MAQRGRKSAASLAVIQGGAGQRAEPPDDLTADQKEEWWAIVGRMPADWFPRETHAMLAQLCRHIARAKSLAHMIDKFESQKNASPLIYVKLLNQENQQSRAIATLATKMRISQQSSYDKSKKKDVKSAPPPWMMDDVAEEEDQE